MKAIRMVAVVTCVLAPLLPPGARAEAFALDVHAQITAQGLSFLTPAARNEIGRGNLSTDALFFFDTSAHFDECDFGRSVAFVNRFHSRALIALDPAAPDLAAAATAFGRLLHTSQDFYAHTNWIELGRRDLVEKGFDAWRPMPAYAVVPGTDVLIVRGDVPPGLDVTLIRGDRLPYPQNAVVRAVRPGPDLLGLISGDVPWEPALGEDCPDSVDMLHGELNKDEPGVPGKELTHEAAKAVAIAQTRHEWCRLLHLVRGQYKEAGDKLLFDNWVANEDAASQCGPATDLALTKSDSPDPATVGRNLTYTLTVQNRGPVDAYGVRIEDILPAGVALVSAATPAGTCAPAAPPLPPDGKVTCRIDRLSASAPDNSATVTLVVRPAGQGVLSNTATVRSRQLDSDLSNNAATATTNVNPAVNITTASPHHTGTPGVARSTTPALD